MIGGIASVVKPAGTSRSAMLVRELAAIKAAMGLAPAQGNFAPRGNAATVTSEPTSPSPVAATAIPAPPAAAATSRSAPSRASKQRALGATAQRLDPNGPPDDSKPKIRSVQRPPPFATTPNIFR